MKFPKAIEELGSHLSGYRFDSIASVLSKELRDFGLFGLAEYYEWLRANNYTSSPQLNALFIGWSAKSILDDYRRFQYSGSPDWVEQYRIICSDLQLLIDVS